METRHTPGPWAVRDESEKYAEVVGESRYVGRVYKWHSSYHAVQYDDVNNELKAEHEANARLIAAAPDLLAALEAAVLRVGLANSEGDMILSAWLPDARAAIARAKGV